MSLYVSSIILRVTISICVGIIRYVRLDENELKIEWSSSSVLCEPFIFFFFEMFPMKVQRQINPIQIYVKKQINNTKYLRVLFFFLRKRLFASLPNRFPILFFTES
jgi:hypothetical protein